MRKLFALILLLAVPMSYAQAPPKPKNKVARFLKAPFEKKNVKLWLAMAPLAVGMALDGRSTSVVLARCPGCAEANPLFGNRPSDQRLALSMTAMFVGQVYVTSALKDYAEGTRKPTDTPAERRFWDHVWIAYPVGVGLGHGRAAKSNYRIADRFRGCQFSGVLGCPAR